MSLEALEFIEEDELIEITPTTFRIKKVLNNRRYKSRRTISQLFYNNNKGDLWNI